MNTLLGVLLPAFLGAISMALIAVGTRFVMKSGKISTLQFLISSHAANTALFGVLYLFMWGFTLPHVLPGFWTAVFCGTTVNIFIQFLNTKASSYNEAEVSLTKPIQSMTPGLITFVGVIFGEWPGTFGWLGVCSMIIGTWILFSAPNKPLSIPFQRLTHSVHLYYRWWQWRKGNGAEIPEEELNTAIIVTLALCSACGGTIGIFFDGLFTRRGLTTQGLILGAMTFTGLFSIIYGLWYVIAPDKTKAEHRAIGFRLFTEARFAWSLIGLSVAWVLHIILFNSLYNETYVAYVGTLKRLSIPIGVVLGFYLFKEREFPKRIKAALFIALGAVLIARDDFVHRISKKIERWVEIHLIASTR